MLAVVLVCLTQAVMVDFYKVADKVAEAKQTIIQ
jgi:hypothetical protein